MEEFESDEQEMRQHNLNVLLSETQEVRENWVHF